jgi:hypothetical protein
MLLQPTIASEIDADVHVDRPQAADGCAERKAGHGLFRDRRIKAAIRAERLDQPVGRAEDLGVVGHADPKHEHVGIALHLLMRRLAQRVLVAKHSHGGILMEDAMKPIELGLSLRGARNAARVWSTSCSSV